MINIDLLCINDSFPADYLEFYRLHGVVIPKEGNIYSPRAITRNSNGDWEILLVELINPECPIKHPILGVAMKEPAWDLHKRFRNLSGGVISEEMIKELKAEEKRILERIEIKPKEL